MNDNMTFNLDPAEIQKLKGLPSRLDDRIKKVVYQSANEAARAGKTVVIRAVMGELNLVSVHGVTGRQRVSRQIRTDYAKNENQPQA